MDCTGSELQGSEMVASETVIFDEGNDMEGNRKWVRSGDVSIGTGFDISFWTEEWLHCVVDLAV